MREAGLPEPWCQTFLNADDALAEQLATDPRVAFLSFIGSAWVGWHLHSKLAHGTRFALEHGGAALHAADHLDVSAVMINDHTAFRTDWMPFAGRRVSGHGVGGIPYSMREMTQEKMRVFRYPAS